MRLTLDCYKLLWVVIEEDLKRIYDNPLARIFCINLQSHEAEARYYEIKRLAQEARRIETKNIGVDPLIAINSYKEVTKKSLELLERIDNSKLLFFNSIIRTVSLKRTLVELLISFIAGILSGIIITYPNAILGILDRFF
jgi:hypothetical protein